MDMDEYEEMTEETAIYPDELPEFVTPGLLYVSLGLGEVGEVHGKVKKAIREDDPEYLQDLVDEAGDVLWYLARLSKELSEIDEVDFDGQLSEVADKNLEKLLDRKERDVLTGEGDKR
jgi:NTP pyrophosphatase (non-canonical NTP hydrolase)